MEFGDEAYGGDGASAAPEDAARRSGGPFVAPAGRQERAGPPSISHPPAYRGVIAGWPRAWREQWGRRANELEDAGLSWRDAEARAFVEVWSRLRQEHREQETAGTRT